MPSAFRSGFIKEVDKSEEVSYGRERKKLMEVVV